MGTAEQQYSEFSGYTFENVWAVIQESHLQSEQMHQKFMQEMHKLTEKHAETNRQMQETNRKMKETDRTNTHRKSIYDWQAMQKEYIRIY